MKNQIKARVRRLAEEKANALIDAIKREEESKRKIMTQIYVVRGNKLGVVITNCALKLPALIIETASDLVY